MTGGGGGGQPPPEYLQDVLAGAPLRRVVPVTQSDLIAVGTVAYQFLEQGQTEKARNAFRALTQLGPNKCLGYYGLGTIALTERKLEEARELLTKAASLKEDDVFIHAGLGEVFLRLGQREEAARMLRRAVELDPNGTHPGGNKARAMLAGMEDADGQ